MVYATWKVASNEAVACSIKVATVVSNVSRCEVQDRRQDTITKETEYETEMRMCINTVQRDVLY